MRINDFVIMALIFCGAIIMFLAIVETDKIFTYVTKNKYIKAWNILRLLMIFFLIGYGVTLVFFHFQQYNILLFLMGLIFLVGAIFVLLVAKLGILTLKDLVRSRLSELQLQQEKDTAIAINETKSRFLANMSHEIRTPMNAILGMTNILLDSKLDQEQQELLKIIQSSGDSLLVIINDILDFSKIEAGKIVLEPVDFNLHECVEQTIILLSNLATNKNLALSFDIAVNVPQLIRLDKNRLRQVLLNLLNNAIKFTNEGEILLQVMKHSENKLLFTVQDSGIGISSEDLNQLFQAFSQVDSNANRRFEGTGLGLAISRNLLEMMQGKIWAESQLDQGSKFSFTVTFEASKSISTSTSNVTQQTILPERNIADENSPVANAQTINILVVEDNKVNQKVIKLIFKKLGYAIDIAHNGLDVLLQIKDKDYQFIFMDISMPQMDGFETTSLVLDFYEVQANKAGVNPPVIIAMTANVMEEDRQKCFQVGMSDFISKPVKPEEITRVMNKNYSD